jgi:hypothetical protein
MLVARIAGLVVISPPLVLAAYWFLRDDELEPHSGKSLYIRAAVCALAYIGLWGMYSFVADPARGILTGELWTWVFVAPPFLFTGALVALASLDLEFGNAFFHYSFYLLVTILLGWMAGMGWIWNLSAAG